MRVVLPPEHSGAHQWRGPGAGALPTGQALYADIHQLEHGRGYRYAKFNARKEGVRRDEGSLEIYVRYPAVGAIDLERFADLSDLGEFQGGQYAIGTIALSDLRDSAWLDDPHIQVIATPENSGDFLLN